jgi:hypothetical protein
MRREWKTGLLAAVLLASGGGLAWGDFAATVDPSQITQTSISMGLTPGESIGWRFFVDQPITITALGLYDAGAQGLEDPHVMGIWRVRKEGGLQLERMVTINDQGDFQADGHVYARIDPFTILPDPEPWINPLTGQPYLDTHGDPFFERWLVGVWNPNDSVDELVLCPPTAAALSIEQADIIRLQNYTYRSVNYPYSSQDTVLSGFWAPWGDTTTGAHFGVNFEYAVVPVPGAVLLGILGLSSAGWLLRRRIA